MPVGVVDVVGVIGCPATSLEQAKVPKTVGMHHQTNAFSITLQWSLAFIFYSDMKMHTISTVGKSVLHVVNNQ